MIPVQNDFNISKSKHSGDCGVQVLGSIGKKHESFTTSAAFCAAFMERIQLALRFTSAGDEYTDAWLDPDVKDFISLGRHITKDVPARHGRVRFMGNIISFDNA